MAEESIACPVTYFSYTVLGIYSQGWAVMLRAELLWGEVTLSISTFFLSKMMTSPKRAVSFPSHAVGPGTSSKTILLSANTSFPHYILLLYSQGHSVLWDGDNLFREASKCLGPGRCTAGESACQAKHWPPAGKHLSYSGSIQNWFQSNCMYNVGCWAVKTGWLSDQCWERDMICPHPLKACYGKGQRALKTLSNEQRGLPVCSKWIPSCPVTDQMYSERADRVLRVLQTCLQGTPRPTAFCWVGRLVAKSFGRGRSTEHHEYWMVAAGRAQRGYNSESAASAVPAPHLGCSRRLHAGINRWLTGKQSFLTLLRDS